MQDKWKGYYLTAYGIAVKHGFKGTEEEWLESLKVKGDKGDKGDTFTYEDFTEEQLAQLKGERGDTPYISENGNWIIGDNDTGIKAEGLTPEEKEQLEQNIEDIKDHESRIDSAEEKIIIHEVRLGGFGDLTTEYEKQLKQNAEDIENLKGQIGDVEIVLDNVIAEQESILAMQNALIGGDSV